jgi:hypothetical protein
MGFIFLELPSQMNHEKQHNTDEQNFNAAHHTTPLLQPLSTFRQ